MQKRGLSPVIATVLLISLGVVLAGIVALWAVNFVNQSKANAEREMTTTELCEKADFSIDLPCFKSDVIIVDATTGLQESEKKTLSFNAGNDQPNQELYGFDIYLTYAGEKMLTSSLAYSEIPGLKSKQITTDIIENIEGLQEVSIVPKIETEKYMIVCKDREQIIKGEDIEEC